MSISMSSVSLTGMSAMQSRSAPPPPPPPDETGQTDILSQFDTDEDGSLSATEVSESPLSEVVSEDNWASIDTDGNGTLSDTELTAHRDPMQEAGQMGGKGGPGGRGGPPMGGGMISEADTTSLFEGLISDADETTDIDSVSASTSAEELYSEMQSLLSALAG